MYQTKLKREYGLEEMDIALMRYLAKHAAVTPSMLARELKVPRTTAHFRLNKLAGRGLCVCKKVRNLSLWSLTPEGLSLLVKTKTKIAEMSLLQGAESLDEMFLKLTVEPHPCRIYMFEPSEQTRLFTKHTNEEVYGKVSDLVKKHDIIVEVLIGEKTLEYAAQMGEKVRKRMHGRPTIAYELNDNILNFEHVIICSKEDVYFFNYKKLTVLHIHSMEVTSTYREMFEFYKSFGRKVDFNAGLKV